MSDKKAPNYTDAQTVELIEAYSDASDDEDRASVVQEYSEEFGKTAASIRMKLVAEKCYIKPAYVSKAGTKTETKGTIVESIAAILGVTSQHLPGLDKATVKALTVIRQSFVDASEALKEAQADQAD